MIDFPTLFLKWYQKHVKVRFSYLLWHDNVCNAGRRTDFWDQKSSNISGETFLERNFWNSITARTTLFPSMSVEWIHFPELEHLLKNVFTTSFPKSSVRNLGCSFVSKKRTRSGSNFPPDWATNISRSISRHYAGSRTDFWDQKSSDFSGQIFSGEEFLEQHYCPYNFVPINVCGVDSFSPN